MTSKGKIARAAGQMSVATFISRVLGFIRDMVLAFYLGASGVSDAFYVSFRIPNLLRELFAEGSMSSGFIPVLSEYHVKEGMEGARGLVRKVFTLLVLLVGVITMIGIVAAPGIISVIAPGFLKDPQKFALTVHLSRMMFPFLIFISLAALVMGSLNTSGVYFLPALASAVFNLAMIATAMVLARHNAILAAALGVLIGGFAQFLFQVPSYFRAGYDFRPDFRFRDPGVRKIIMLILPATVGMAVAQINIVTSNVLASFLPAGSITYLFYSMRLIHFPVGIFGVAMGLAVLPALSSHAVKKDFEALRQDFSFALRLLFFITLPSMAGLIALRFPIISTLFYRGRFDLAAVDGTAQALLFYSMGIWAMVGVRVIAATFYSMQDTRRPVKSAVIALSANIVLSIVLMFPLKASGLALANSLSSMINFTVLFYLLRKKLGRVEGRRIARSFVKSVLASALMGAGGYLFLRSGMWEATGMAFEKAVRLSAGVALSIGIYMLVCYLLKSEELGYLIDYLKRRFASSRYASKNP